MPPGHAPCRATWTASPGFPPHYEARRARRREMRGLRRTREGWRTRTVLRPTEFEKAAQVAVHRAPQPEGGGKPGR